MKKKWTHRHIKKKKETYVYQRGKVGRKKLGLWD